MRPAHPAKLTEGQTDPDTLAALADPRVRCGRVVLADALCGHFRPIHQKPLGQLLERWNLPAQHIEDLHRPAAARMQSQAAPSNA